jgi:hypothetical protein
MDKTASIPIAVSQHLLRDYPAVLSRRFVAGKLVTLRIRNRLSSAHDDIEKVSWHHGNISNQNNSLGAAPY